MNFFMVDLKIIDFFSRPILQIHQQNHITRNEDRRLILCRFKYLKAGIYTLHTQKCLKMTKTEFKLNNEINKCMGIKNGPYVHYYSTCGLPYLLRCHQIHGTLAMIIIIILPLNSQDCFLVKIVKVNFLLWHCERLNPY